MVVSVDSQNVSLSCRIKANPSVNPASIQWQYDALMAVAAATPNDASKQSQETRQHGKFNTTLGKSNNSKPDIKRRNNIKPVTTNDSWNYNNNKLDPHVDSKATTVWKVVKAVTTGQGTPGYTVDTSVSPFAL